MNNQTPSFSEKGENSNAKIAFKADILKLIKRGYLDYFLGDTASSPDQEIESFLKSQEGHAFIKMLIKYNGDMQLFLKTTEGEDFLKIVGYNEDLSNLYGERSINKETHKEKNKKSGKFSRLVIYLMTMLSLQGNLSCKKSIEKDNINSEVGVYSEAISQIKIDDQDNVGIEKKIYKDAFLAFKKSEKSLKNLFPDDEISFHRFLPLMIKESRLQDDIVSRSGAIGYFQLKGDAIDDVNKILKAKGMSTQYSPRSNPSDNTLYGVIYFMKMHEQLKEKHPDMKDLDKFVYATYNAGLSRMNTLIDDSDCSSWEDFIDYIQDIMDLSNKDASTKKTAYGVDINNIFDKDYTDNKEVVYDKGAKLTKGKAQELVNYVENINAIANAINKSVDKVEVYATIDLIKGEAFFNTVKKIVQEKNLKIKDGNDLGVFCNDVLIDNNINPNNIPVSGTLYITKQMMELFDYLDTNEYSYETVSYNKEKMSFLGKILEEKMTDKEFVDDIINKVSEFRNIEDKSDITFYMKNMIIAFNTDNRRGWSTTTSKDVRIPTDPKYYNEYMNGDNTDQIQQEEISEESDQLVDITKNYIDISLDKKGGESIDEGNYNSSEIKNIEKKIINVEGNQQKNKEKLNTPIYIVLHSTADSRDRNYDSQEVVSNVKAHFVVSETGKVYRLTQNGDLRKLNHAGASKKVGATWRGDDQVTYKAIGIEVEANDKGEKWNNLQYNAVKELISYLGKKYHIKKKNVVTHSQIANSKFGRGRKTDPCFVDRNQLGLPDNYKLLDLDVARGLVDPNRSQIVMELKSLHLTDKQIRAYLQGVDAGIALKKKRN